MTAENDRIGVTDGNWAFALDHRFVDMVHLAIQAPYEKGSHFQHKKVNYFRGDDGNVYREVTEE